MIDLTGPHGGLIAMGFGAGWIACWGVLEKMYRQQLNDLKIEIEKDGKERIKENESRQEEIKRLNDRLQSMEDLHINQITAMIEKLGSVIDIGSTGNAKDRDSTSRR